MPQFMVTVKIQRDHGHDPHNKKTDFCPVGQKKMCTDSTGEHHTILVEMDSLEGTASHFVAQGVHVTRIEEV